MNYYQSALWLPAAILFLFIVIGLMEEEIKRYMKEGEDK